MILVILIKMLIKLLFMGTVWNLDLSKSLGTGHICSLNGGFVISNLDITNLKGTTKMFVMHVEVIVTE